MKDKIIEILNSYRENVSNDSTVDNYAIEEGSFNELAEELVKKFNISGVGSTLCSCGSLKAKPKTDMSKPYECAECDKPIYKN